MTTVYLKDCVKLRYCMSGVRGFCSRLGLDYDRLRKVGLEESAFTGVDDVYVARLIAQAKKREAGNE